jgi:LemA protein
MTFWIGLLVGAVVISLFVMGSYNRLVRLRQETREAWSAIETELRRRYDLIPNLVETVKGYAGHERETLEAVVKARNAAVLSGPVEQQVQSQNVLGQALGRLMALSEAYPQLKANENFNALQSQLSETETRISQARRFYNAVVKELNTTCESFPTVLIAGPFGFHGQPYFGIEDAAAFEPVQVSFGASQDDKGVRLKVESQEKILEPRGDKP